MAMRHSLVSWLIIMDLTFYHKGKIWSCGGCGGGGDGSGDGDGDGDEGVGRNGGGSREPIFSGGLIFGFWC